MRLNSFELDITYDCNLHCRWCNRLCGTKYQKPEHISLEQFKRNIQIIEPHIDNQTAIRVIGGEPTLHPQIFNILDFLLQNIRPKMRFAIDIYSNGVGLKVCQILNKIRSKYSTFTVFGSIPQDSTAGLKRLSSSKDFNIVVSKGGPTGAYSIGLHESIYRAAQDVVPNIDYTEDCNYYHYCGYGITMYGIFICAMAAHIAVLFKLKGGLDHFPLPQEEEEQKQLYCKYCFSPCDTLEKSKVVQEDISSTYQKALRDWDENPYFLPKV